MGLRAKELPRNEIQTGRSETVLNRVQLPRRFAKLAAARLSSVWAVASNRASTDPCPNQRRLLAEEQIRPHHNISGASRDVAKGACSNKAPLQMSLREPPNRQTQQRAPVPPPERPRARPGQSPPDDATSSVATAPNSANNAAAAALVAPSSTFPTNSGPLVEVGFWADPRDEGDQRPNPALWVDEEWGGTVAALAVALYVRSGFLESFELGYSFCRLGCRGSDGGEPAKSGGCFGRETSEAAQGAVALGRSGRVNDDVRCAAEPADGGPARNKFMGCTTLTDGKYVWPEGLAHYVTAHAVRPPEEFVRHALENLQALREAQEGGRLRWDVDARGVGRTVPLSPGTAVFLRDKTTLGIALPPEPEVRKEAPTSGAGASKGGLCWGLLSRQGQTGTTTYTLK